MRTARSGELTAEQKAAFTETSGRCRPNGTRFSVLLVRCLYVYKKKKRGMDWGLASDKRDKVVKPTSRIQNRKCNLVAKIYVGLRRKYCFSLTSLSRKKSRDEGQMRENLKMSTCGISLVGRCSLRAQLMHLLLRAHVLCR